MKTNFTIRTKLTLNFTAIVASIFIVFAFSIYLFSSDYRHGQFISRLEEKAFTTAKLLFEVEQVDSVLLKIIERADQTILYKEKVVIFDKHNNIIYDSQDGVDFIHDVSLIDKIREEKRVEGVKNGREFVGITYKEGKNNFIVVAGAYDYFGYNKLYNLRRILFISFSFSIIILFLLGWLFAGRTLKPISLIIEQVGNISSQNLHLRLETGEKKDELSQLAKTFNDMLNRIESAFKTQKEFVSNASHELRTPLTIIKSQIDVTLLNERTTEEYKKLLLSLSDDIENLSSITNSLLLLAQTSTDFAQFTYTRSRIDDILWHARKSILDTNPHYNISISFEREPQDESELILFCNNFLLRIACLNLIENACKFSNDNSATVLINFYKTHITITLKDKGIGIPENELKKIFKPFYRAQNSININGHGIGLSLVENIIKIHKGNIAIDSKIDVGTNITIKLPYIR